MGNSTRKVTGLIRWSSKARLASRIFGRQFGESNLRKGLPIAAALVGDRAIPPWLCAFHRLTDILQGNTPHLYATLLLDLAGR